MGELVFPWHCCVFALRHNRVQGQQSSTCCCPMRLPTKTDAVIMINHFNETKQATPGKKASARTTALVHTFLQSWTPDGERHTNLDTQWLFLSRTKVVLIYSNVSLVLVFRQDRPLILTPPSPPAAPQGRRVLLVKFYSTLPRGLSSSTSEASLIFFNCCYIENSKSPLCTSCHHLRFLCVRVETSVRWTRLISSGFLALLESCSPKEGKRL